MIVDLPAGWLTLGDLRPIGHVVDVAFHGGLRPECLQARQAYIRQTSFGHAGGDQEVMDWTEAWIVGAVGQGVTTLSRMDCLTWAIFQPQSCHFDFGYWYSSWCNGGVSDPLGYPPLAALTSPSFFEGITDETRAVFYSGHHYR